MIAPEPLALALTPGVSAWLTPTLLRYRRGAWGAAGLVATLLLLPFAWWILRGLAPAPAPARATCAWLSLAFLVPALLCCAVGYRDRRPATIATLLALLGLGSVALGAGAAGWAGFVVFLALAAARAFTDPPPTADERAASAARNRTRRARSIVRKLVREGRLPWIPVYFLLRLSDLGREGIERSGSYRFADHIYRNQPSGRGLIGRLVDRALLALPASRAFHQRYKRAQAALRDALGSFPEDGSPRHVLAVPCGIPRDLTELAATLRAEDPALLSRIHYHGMDIDPELLPLARDFTAGCGVPRLEFRQGDALCFADYPRCGMHAVVSTGLGEFLDDAQLAAFYRNVHAALRPGGTFYTSVTAHDPRSDAFLRAFELLAHYRTPEQVARILHRLPWSRLTLTPDATGLQTFVVAVK